jgi:hypothetical protein
MSISFKHSFQEAFKFYIESGTGDKLETALKNIGDFPPGQCDTRETFESSLLEIVLQHRLHVLNYFLFITYYKLTKMFTYLAHPHDTITPMPIDIVLGEVIIIVPVLGSYMLFMLNCNISSAMNIL